jgi:hypothetical protein
MNAQETLVCLVLAEVFPHLMPFADVEVDDEQLGERDLFKTSLRRQETRVRLVFSQRALAHAAFFQILQEAGRSAEQLLLGAARAEAKPLQAIDYWLMRQKELPCSD